MTARRRVFPAPSQLGEFVRLFILGGAVVWFLHPYFTVRQVGTGDALWYANILGDFVTQSRAGIFPIFAGQSDFAFNGSVYPLRAAPLYQSVGGLLDALTAHRLGFFALQHLIAIVWGAAGIFSAYFCLAALAPLRRWEAVGLAILYLGCPAVLGVLFTQDLYMTWMTLPFLPVVLYASLRSFRRDDWFSSALLAASLAGLWWAHAPVAFWATALAFLWQLTRLLCFDRNRYAWRRAVGCAALFLLLAQYPFVSVKALQSSGLPATLAGFENPEQLGSNIAAAFPANLSPLSPGASRLSDLQLGYGLWAMLLVIAVTLKFVRLPEVVVCSVGTLLLLFFLFPFPGNGWAYGHLPTYVLRLTYYWPMQRLYLPLVAIVTTTAVICFDLLASRSRPFARGARGLLVLSCLWCVWESRQFARAGRDRTLTRVQSAQNMRPENRLLMNHEYGLFNALPPYFSNGTMSAAAETRLLAADTQLPLIDPGAPPFPPPDATTAAGDWHPLAGHVDENPGVVKMDTGFVLQPGRRYELALAVLQKTAPGIFQISGTTFFREYVLPLSGQPRAFGAAETNSHTLPLWTTAAAPEKIILRFIPTAPEAKAAGFLDFGRFAIREINPDRAPVQLLGLVPFRAETRATVATLLETPRMFQPGYSARVDGQPAAVIPTSNLLVAIPLSAGNHEVTLRFVGLWPLRLAYSFSLTLWIFFLTLVPVLYFTRYRI